MAQWSEQSSLASHICGPVSTSGVDTICASRVSFFFGYSGFCTLLVNQPMVKRSCHDLIMTQSFEMRQKIKELTSLCSRRRKG